MTLRDISGGVDTLILWCQNLYPHYTQPGEDGALLTYVTKPHKQGGLIYREVLGALVFIIIVLELI